MIFQPMDSEQDTRWGETEFIEEDMSMDQRKNHTLCQIGLGGRI